MIRADMKQGIITAVDLVRLLDDAAADFTVYAPVEEEGVAAFGKRAVGTDPLLDFTNVKLSPKGIFFPQSEVLGIYANSELKPVPLPEDDLLVFGMRPCDAVALQDLDKIFGGFGSAEDPYYMSRRENSLVIALACTQPGDSCFCSTLGGGPAHSSGSDIMAHHLGDRLLFEAVTTKGDVFMGKHKQLFADCVGAVCDRRNSQVARAEDQLHALDIEGIADTFRNGFDLPAWKPVSATCISCGLCTYVCPTCHCFDITDESDGNSCRRIRSWDSCQFSLFTLHASGHNPRPSSKERMRQRILHKFLYTLDNVGETFCVGCGRCVRNCPVNLDIREQLQKLKGAGTPVAGNQEATHDSKK